MKDDSVVKAAIRFMWLNYQHEINLDRIAAHAMYSKFYFLRRFKESTGVTPGRFLTTIRLARSKEMLAREPDLSVTDIAMAVGYDSSGAFSTKFRQVVGMTPSEYRAVHLDESGYSETVGRLAARGFGMSEEGVRHHGRLSGYQPGGMTVTFVGLFEGIAPQGHPIGCAVVSGPDRQFDLQVPPGRWNVMAVSFADDGEDSAVAVGSTGILDFTLGVPAVDLVVEMRDDVDHALPVLGAFPEFNAIRQHAELQHVV